MCNLYNGIDLTDHQFHWRYHQDRTHWKLLGVISNDSGLGDTFNEIDDLSDQCRYKDCTHTVETGCAILEAVERGEISEERYNNFIKIYKESLYNEMSYVDKREKDKKFGKYVRSVMKQIKNKKGRE